MWQPLILFPFQLWAMLEQHELLQASRTAGEEGLLGTGGFPAEEGGGVGAGQDSYLPKLHSVCRGISTTLGGISKNEAHKAGLGLYEEGLGWIRDTVGALCSTAVLQCTAGGPVMKWSGEGTAGLATRHISGLTNVFPSVWLCTT